MFGNKRNCEKSIIQVYREKFFGCMGFIEHFYFRLWLEWKYHHQSCQFVNKGKQDTVLVKSLLSPVRLLNWHDQFAIITESAYISIQSHICMLKLQHHHQNRINGSGLNFASWINSIRLNENHVATLCRDYDALSI